MQPHSARWACAHHMAAMTKAAKAFRELRGSLLGHFPRKRVPRIPITGSATRRSRIGLQLTLITLFGQYYGKDASCCFLFLSDLWSDEA